MSDHVDLLVSRDPQCGMQTLWINRYFVATVGGANLEVVKRYVGNQ